MRTSRRNLLKTVGVTSAVTFSGAGVASFADAEEHERSGDETASVRVAHASPDAPNVDVWVDDSKVLSDVPFTAVSDYLNVPTGTRTVEITAAGDPDTVAFSGDLSVEVETYTVAAIGELTYDATEFEPWVLTDDADPGDDEALVRLAHASPDAPNVDVTVTDGETTLFEDVGYSEASDYVSVPDGSYTLEVRPADGDDGAEPVAEFDVDVTTGCTYTAFAEGYLTPDDEPLDEPFDLVVAVDGA